MLATYMYVLLATVLLASDWLLLKETELLWRFHVICCNIVFMEKNNKTQRFALIHKCVAKSKNSYYSRLFLLSLSTTLRAMPNWAA